MLPPLSTVLLRWWKAIVVACGLQRHNRDDDACLELGLIRRRTPACTMASSMGGSSEKQCGTPRDWGNQVSPFAKRHCSAVSHSRTRDRFRSFFGCALYAIRETWEHRAIPPTAHHGQRALSSSQMRGGHLQLSIMRTLLAGTQ